MSLSIFSDDISIIIWQNDEKKQIVPKVYHDIEEGFGSKQATLAKAKKGEPTMMKEDVDKFMRQQPNKQAKKYSGSNSFIHGPICRI